MGAGVLTPLETERLLMRQLGQDDFETFARWMADPEVVRYLGTAPMTREEAWRNLAMWLGHWTLRGHGQWAVVERDTGELVGRVGLHNPEGWPGLEVGWLVDPSRWGRGYATEAGLASIRCAHEQLGVGHIISIIHPDNKASIKVAENIGEVFERADVVRGVEVLIYGRDLP